MNKFENPGSVNSYSEQNGLDPRDPATLAKYTKVLGTMQAMISYSQINPLVIEQHERKESGADPIVIRLQK